MERSDLTNRTTSTGNELFLYEVVIPSLSGRRGRGSLYRRSKLFFRVSYSQMSQFMRRLNRLGGKIVSIKPLNPDTDVTGWLPHTPKAETFTKEYQYQEQVQQDKETVTESSSTPEAAIESSSTPERITESGSTPGVITESQKSIEPSSQLPWWVEISTKSPHCLYYFGPFDSFAEAQSHKPGYVDDLEKEGALGITVEIKQCQPVILTQEWQ